MSILIYLLFFLFSLGQLGRVSLLNQQANIYLYEIVMVILMIYFFLKYNLAPIKKIILKIRSLIIFISILIATYIINLFGFNLFENTIALLYLLRLIFYVVFFGYFYTFYKDSKTVQKVVKKCFFYLSILFLLTSVIQFFLYPDLRNLYYLGWDPHLNRLFGVFFDTSIAAAILGMFFLYFLVKKNYLLTLFFLFIFILTFSRSAYISLSIAVLAYFIKDKDYKKIILFIVLFFILFFISPKNFGQGVNLTRLFSIESRLKDYSQAILVWKKSPIIGYGYNRIGFIKDRFNLTNKNENFPSHANFSFSSSYLIILVTTGILGLLSFVYLFISISLTKNNLKFFIAFLMLISLADNIILHPFVIFLIGTISIIL